MNRLVLALLVALLPTAALGQTSVLQGGSWTSGLLPMYSSSGGGSQPLVQQSATAAGGPQSIKEMSIVKRGSGSGPFVGGGGGYLGSTNCMYDNQPSAATGGHQLCFDPNATGGFGLLSFNSFGGAADIPFKLSVNGTVVEFPFSTSGVVGPGSTTVGRVATWANTSGTLLGESATPLLTIGGSSGQLQYNNAGALGGFTLAGDCTLSQPNITCTKVNGQTVNLGASLTSSSGLAVDLFTGAAATLMRLRAGANTDINLPATGTVATLAGAEAFTNKTYNGLTLNATTGTFALTNGKTLTVSNTLGFTGTDGSTLNVGAGGTLGTAAYTAATAYVPSNTQITASLGADVDLNNTGNYFTGPSVAQGSTGTWFCSGQVTLTDTAGAANFSAKLWDGTSVIDSGFASAYTTNAGAVIALSGYLATPVGNIRISAKDTTSTSGKIKFNATGESKDSTLSCFRVN